MKNTLLAAALLAIGAWTAGASAQPQPVTVTLVGDQIRADPDRLIVERRMGRNVVIRWQLAAGRRLSIRSDRHRRQRGADTRAD